MIFFITFLEGIMTFLSPCLLPMIPIYLGYLAGKDQKQSIVKNALGFILGFTLMFSLLGLASGTIGVFTCALLLCPKVSFQPFSSVSFFPLDGPHVSAPFLVRPSC